MLIRIPTAADYALKVPKEQELLPQLAKRCLVFFAINIDDVGLEGVHIPSLTITSYGAANLYFLALLE